MTEAGSGAALLTLIPSLKIKSRPGIALPPTGPRSRSGVGEGGGRTRPAVALRIRRSYSQASTSPVRVSLKPAAKSSRLALTDYLPQVAPRAPLDKPNL